MCPDVQANVYSELANIKAIKPVNHGYNILKLHVAMKLKRISIEQKVPDYYHESQYIMDYHDVSLTIEAKRDSKLRSTSFTTNTFAETLTDEMHHTLVAK